MSHQYMNRMIFTYVTMQVIFYIDGEPSMIFQHHSSFIPSNSNELGTLDCLSKLLVHY